ncbi:hypothetical protein QUW02_07905, partial [Bacteroides eggerthii]|nr:hypothetical protein [Bacteroides eggerthii]
MKWRILFFIFLMPITGHLGAQHLIEGKYLPELQKAEQTVTAKTAMLLQFRRGKVNVFFLN